MKTLIRFSLLLLTAFALATPMSAKDKKHDDDKDRKGDEHHHDQDPRRGGPELRPIGPKDKEEWGKVVVILSPREREIIQHYTYEKTKGKFYWNKSKHLPPGLSKKLAHGGKLPPGWEKKVCKGEVLVPVVHAECQPLPPELVVQLPPPPPDTINVCISGKVVRLLNATHEILDVFDVKY